MLCPKCDAQKTKTLKTEQIGGKTKRVRFCMKCSFSFVSEEKPVLITFTEEEKEEYEEYLAEIATQSEKDR